MTVLNLQKVLTAAATSNKQLDSQTAELQDISTRQADLANENADLLTQIGSNAFIIEATKQNAELRVQDAKIKAANNLGTNYQKQGEVLSSLSETIASEYLEKDSALKAIKEKQSVSFFDDPLAFIVNRFTINDDIRRHNAASDRLSAAEDQMQKLNTLTQSTAQTQAMLAEGITQASIKASTDNIALQAQAQANLQKIQGDVYNADGIKAALNANREKLQTVFSVFGAEKAEQQAEMALKQLEWQREKFAWEKEERVKGKQTDEYWLGQINKGITIATGGTGELLQPGSVKAGQVLSLLKSNNPLGKEFQDYYMIAEQTGAAGIRMLAPTPAKAIELLNSNIPVKLSPAQDSVRKLLDEAVTKVASNPNIDLKNVDARTKALNSQVEALVAGQSTKIVPGDKDNIFNIPSVQQLVSESPTLQKLPVVQKVIVPLLSTGADLSDPNKVFQATMVAMKEGKITYPQALEITTLYQTGVATNLASRQLTSLGIKPKYSYNVAVATDEGAMFGGTEVLDLTKPDVVGRAFNKAMSRSMFRDAINDAYNPFEAGANFVGAMKGEGIPANSGFPNYIPTTRKQK